MNNTDNLIDSRDIIERIEELESELEDLKSAVEETEESDDQESIDDIIGLLKDWERDYQEELDDLRNLQTECETYCSDWKYGATLIHEDYFEDYAKELAEDCGMVDRSLSWPMNCIDWEEAADQLKMDYTEVDFGGQTYYIR